MFGWTSESLSGRIGRAHGLAGELYSFPRAILPTVFDAGAVFLTDEQPARRLEVLKSRRHQDRLLVGFAEITSRTEAESFRDVGLTSHGRRAATVGGERILARRTGRAGRQGSRPTGPWASRPESKPAALRTDSLCETAPGQEVLVPFVGELVPEVRMAEGSVVINPIEGLLNPSPD